MIGMVLRDMIKNKQAIQGLRSEKLRKIRYELRTLLRLEYDSRIERVNQKWRMINENTEFTPCQRMELREPLVREEERLTETRHKYPINCIVCGDRMHDLFYYPQYGWICSLCKVDYEGSSS